jgi:hypothetical protein
MAELLRHRLQIVNKSLHLFVTRLLILSAQDRRWMHGREHVRSDLRRHPVASLLGDEELASQDALRGGRAEQNHDFRADDGKFSV